MHSQIPMLNVGLHVSPAFTGRILVYVKNGVVISDNPIGDEEIIASPRTITEMLERAGYRITPINKG
ncbi:hypothetical protein [Klebsiella oxytoca]|uniref:hypothetical protein n=1 Tax=Klebsiella oxytoca TaxID=571 RepID=UPI003981F199